MMRETVVHVTTLEQWKSVLDVWFKQGYEWHRTGKSYHERYFDDGWRFLLLNKDNDILKPTWGRQSIEYSEFMAQQKEDNKMETVYEVSQSVFDELQRIKAHEGMSLIESIVAHAQFIKSIEVGNKAILRYLADDPAIEFKVKETLYRLWRIDDFDDKVYMSFNDNGTPVWTYSIKNCFTAPLEEIKKWQTPAWEIEKAD
ncbi:hypothetical protein QMA60_09110 [Leuconostoc suionicum]|uniref:hypothetical protein n=1 Tax=Leuconostoc suionicum TaxID=1511761 RepID=UPI0024AC9CE4|nr:hypothetical protein [Leuconostoc suionicum]MDI6497899.1 hypothetical protein [Leuconostoc suionicum]MDI6499980.1 hypothetical protein [Leuconostoc suionicum]MDI6502917.1 hypothetical protein [Leuconostoc suionicum]MDI6613960.1 hypothetical protein [Leuconostoc suionicum]MDI6665776.1 hypothetical protein [Leuconostoc suionicum]